MKKKLILGVLGLAAVVTPILAFASGHGGCGRCCPFC